MRIKNRHKIFFYRNIKYSTSLSLKFDGVDIMEKLTFILVMMYLVYATTRICVILVTKYYKKKIT